MHAIQGAEDEWRATSDPGEMQSRTGNECYTHNEGPESSRNSFSDEASGFDAVLSEIRETQEAQRHLKKSMEILKINYQRDHMVILEAIEDGDPRCNSLERELTDLTEFYQKEVLNLKEELNSIKEKIDYAYCERTDFHEAMEFCCTRLRSVEQQQRVVRPERDEDTLPRTALGKLIGVLLAVLTAILVFVSLASHCVILLKPSSRMISVLSFTIVFYFLWKYRNVILLYFNHQKE